MEAIVTLNNKADIDLLANQINNKKNIRQRFNFKEDKYKKELFEQIDVDLEEFEKKYFYYNSDKKLHISESSKGFMWISTMGLTPIGYDSSEPKDKLYYALNSQFFAVEVIYNSIKKVIEDEKVYDIEGYDFDWLNSINNVLVHNVIFFYELIAKEYLCILGVTFKKNHKLKDLYNKVKLTMYQNNHNDSFFEYWTIRNINELIKFIDGFDGNFQEHFIKYNDNGEDIIIFSYDNIDKLWSDILFSYESISNFYYDKETFYFKTGRKASILEKAKTAEDKEKIKKYYDFKE